MQYVRLYKMSESGCPHSARPCVKPTFVLDQEQERNKQFEGTMKSTEEVLDSKRIYDDVISQQQNASRLSTKREHKNPPAAMAGLQTPPTCTGSEDTYDDVISVQPSPSRPMSEQEKEVGLMGLTVLESERICPYVVCQQQSTSRPLTKPRNQNGSEGLTRLHTLPIGTGSEDTYNNVLSFRPSSSRLMFQQEEENRSTGFTDEQTLPAGPGQFVNKGYRSNFGQPSPENIYHDVTFPEEGLSHTRAKQEQRCEHSTYLRPLQISPRRPDKSGRAVDNPEAIPLPPANSKHQTKKLLALVAFAVLLNAAFTTCFVVLYSENKPMNSTVTAVIEEIKALISDANVINGTIQDQENVISALNKSLESVMDEIENLRSELHQKTSDVEILRATGACDFHYSNVCYWLEIHSQMDTNLLEAKSICGKRNSAVGDVTNQTQYELLVNKIRSSIPRILDKVELWIGLNQNPSNGDVTLSSNDRAPYVKWFPDEPDRNPNDKKIRLIVSRASTSISHGMADYSESGSYNGVVCQYKIQ